YFEITTAAAFLAFARTPADVVLLETGLGGRLDATNVIRCPAATAITPVSLDHQAFLGDTITAIAGEKAGILKPGSPAIIGPQPAQAAEVFATRAAELAVPLYRFGAEWRCEPDGGGMRYEGPRWRLDLPLPSLLGAHQIINAGTAIACLEQLTGLPLSRDAIAAGLRRINWPARLQRLSRGALVEMLPEGWELWLDGGHNPGAGEVLAAVAASWRDRALYLVVGMLNTKDAVGFLAPLARHARALWSVTIPGEDNPLPAAAIAAAAGAVGLPARESSSTAAAVHDITALGGAARILICGSLHLAGVVLADNR
ncbi:MAG: bifunctional folylpolyglutamate synthase/dihydrofolate synthase, partial [Stellaceae bacterium]